MIRNARKRLMTRTSVAGALVLGLAELAWAADAVLVED
jgi:hypothetical protein